MAKRKKDKRTNNDLQIIAQKTKDQVTQTALKTGLNSCAPEGLQIPALRVTPVLLLLSQTR